jgi:Resolvase, N terminal domain
LARRPNRRVIFIGSIWAKLARPELFRLLADGHAGDILLVEQVDRLSRLTAADWNALKAQLAAKRIRVVALDLPTSWLMAAKVNVVHMPAKAARGRSSAKANQTTSFFFVSGFGSGAYSAKLLNGTRQRFSGFSQPRQCGEAVLRMFVTGGPPVRGDGGMPHRIIASSVPVPVFRITGAG